MDDTRAVVVDCWRSVAVYTEETTSVKHGELGNKSQQQAGQIDDKMRDIVVGVEAGHDKKNNRNRDEEFARGCVLLAGVNLFPMCEKAAAALVTVLPGCTLHTVQQDEIQHVVDESSKRPGGGHRENRDGQQ